MKHHSKGLVRTAASSCFLAVSLAVSSPVPAGKTDSVTLMCLDLNRSKALCQCAADKLRDKFGDQKYALYQEVGSKYREGLAKDKSRDEAWDAGIITTAKARGESIEAVLAETNAMDRAHRMAMKACPEMEEQ